MERAIQGVMARVEEADINLTLETLRTANRPLLPMRFSSDTNLQKFEVVASYNTLMKDFPINLLLTATDLEAINEAVVEIFQHMKRVKHTRYPVERVQQLELAISRDLNDQLLKVLRGHSLMHIR
jgi:dynein heavy chain 1